MPYILEMMNKVTLVHLHQARRKTDAELQHRWRWAGQDVIYLHNIFVLNSKYWSQIKYLNRSIDEGLLRTLSQLIHWHTNDSVAPSHPHSLTQFIPYHHNQSLVSMRELRWQYTLWHTHGSRGHQVKFQLILKQRTDSWIDVLCKSWHTLASYPGLPE